MSHELSTIQDFYAIQLKKHGPHSPMALHWLSKETQELRFVMLALIGDLNGHSVLDVGCGVGDLYRFFETEQIKVKYTGWDISPDMVTAAQKKYPAGKFLAKNIEEDIQYPPFEYVLASGTMNIRIADHDRWVHAMIEAMYRQAVKGVGFNLLSVSSNQQDDTFYYADPEKIYAYCRTLTPYVTLRHDYLAGDFTVYLYKSL